jgi:hypothetical protein
MDPFPERPRYMHRKTYEKLRRKGFAAEQRAFSGIGERRPLKRAIFGPEFRSRQFGLR